MKCDDPITANDIDQDHSGTMNKIIIFFSFKLIKLTMAFLMTTYYIGIVFYVYCDLTRSKNDDNYTDDFIQNFHFEDLSPLSISIRMTYYAFTTLSTVGFGDLHPRSNEERIFIMIVMFCGVSLFTLIKSIFDQNFTEIKDMHLDFDDSDELDKFFGLIKSFNNQTDLDPDLRKNIEDYFQYKWIFDKNNALRLIEI